MSLPIEYDVIVLLEGNQKHEFSLDEPGWLMKPEVRQAKVFTLTPKEGVTHLPLISVDLSTPSGGTPWELVYFSRVFGNMALASTPLFRVYALGRKANVGGRAVRQMQYVYPSGAVLLAEEPLFVDELINKYLQAHYEATVADLREGETLEEAAVRRYNLR